MSSLSGSNRSSRIRRPPPMFGNTVSSDQAYGSDDDCALDEEEDESDGWGSEAGDSSGDASDFDDGEEEGSATSGRKAVKDTPKTSKTLKTKAAKSKAVKSAPPSKRSKTSPPASKASKAPKIPAAKATASKSTTEAMTQSLLPAFAKPLAAKAKAAASKGGSGFKPLLQRPKEGPKGKEKADGNDMDDADKGATEAPESETEDDSKDDHEDDSHDTLNGDSKNQSKINSNNNSDHDSKGNKDNSDDNISDISEDPDLASLDNGNCHQQARKTIGGRAPAVHTAVKRPSVSARKTTGALPPAVKSNKTTVAPVKSAAKPQIKPSIMPSVKSGRSVSVKPGGKSLPPTPKSKKDDVVKSESENEVETKGDVNVKAEDEEEAAEPSNSAGKSASSSTGKRKRSGGSDEPRKLAPAEKVTPEMRRGIVDLFLNPDYMNKVDFNSVGSAFPDQTTGKLKRHWREVLGPDARTFVRDGSPRAGRPSPKGGLGKAHRAAIWDAVAKAYEGAKWAELEAECGMTATKLRRHFRDVLKKDVANMIARE